MAEFDDPSTQLTGGVIDDVPLVGDAPDTDWQSMVDDAVDQVDPGDPGFDIL